MRGQLYCRLLGGSRLIRLSRPLLLCMLASETWFVTMTATHAGAASTSGWTIQSTPNPAGETDSELDGVSCPAAKVCIAVGQYTTSGVARTLSERWNGKRWKVEATPNPAGAKYSSLVGISCISKRACAAVGMWQNSSGDYLTLVERWNGKGWSIQPSPTPSGGGEAFLIGVSCATPTACIAVGDHGNPGNVFTEAWDGTKWSIQSTPSLNTSDSDFQAVACSSATACTAVGFGLNTAGGAPYTLAERWDGSSWTVQPTLNPSGSTGSFFDGVACPSATACIATGSYSNGSTQLTLAEVFDGTSWAIVPTPNASAGPAGNMLEGVACTAATACTTVGFYFNNSRPLPLAEAWNGTDWAIQSVPDPPDSTGTLLLRVACTAVIACTAVGTYNNGSGQSTLVERHT